METDNDMKTNTHIIAVATVSRMRLELNSCHILRSVTYIINNKTHSSPKKFLKCAYEIS